MHKLRNTIIIISVLLLGVLSVLFFWLRKDAPNDELEPVTEINQEQEEIVIPDWYDTDKDGDGMEDSKEEELGTSIYEPDTDFDGLTDDVEIQNYGTDPTNPDTDGDGFWDGLEILNGYNPLGEGKLEIN